ncbi:MAG: oxidoreductase [Candidatus Lokiarchaeota archaeon]|nr:oxidoreductase [Candidatus Lokiarchaeota archaeon]MBD3201838.1 oxidoreductase [Candidatus Lokiarchaeota archaeon]
MRKVYVTPRSITKHGHPALKFLEDAGFEVILATPGIQPTEEQQLDILPECDAYLAGIEPITEKILKKAKKLKIISRNGVGIDNINLEVAKNLNIPVKIAAGSNSQGVAELAVALMFASARAIPICNDRIKQGIWEREKGFELKNKILGVIGTGNIGKRVIKMALDIGMEVIGYDLYPDKRFNPSNKFEYRPLEDLIRISDIITLHCPPSERPLINENLINNMKNGIVIINTARSAVVNGDDILEGLNSGKISRYATDVYDQEPPKINELIKHKNSITTPHIGGYTQESVDRATEVAVKNIINFFKIE